MRRPPSLATLSRYPVTGGIGVLPIAVTLVWWSGRDIVPFLVSPLVGRGHVWPLATSIFPHADILHLAFNLYWLWVFGTLVEEIFGSLRAAGLVLFLAVVSSAAEYAILGGGVGLSGVGYGLFGFVWVLSRKDPRFAGTMDSATVWLFILWFFLCIGLTAADILPVGNVAHGAGALFGILLGFCVADPRRRAVLASLTGFLVLLVGLAASVGRPYVNLSGDLAGEYAYLGYLDLEAGHNVRALECYRRAVELDDRQPGWWYNLGIAYQHLERYQEADLAYQRAVDQDSNSANFRQALVQCKTFLGNQEFQRGNVERAVKIYRDALAVEKENAQLWLSLGSAYQRLGRNRAARKAYEQATSLEINQP
jgi:GlpG protein